MQIVRRRAACRPPLRTPSPSGTAGTSGSGTGRNGARRHQPRPADATGLAHRHPPHVRMTQDGEDRARGHPGPMSGLRVVHRPSSSSPTAAAPRIGPCSPHPDGTIRVPREYSRQAERSSSSWAAVKNGSPNPSATDPATTARRRSRRFATDATARPTSRPARASSRDRPQPPADPVDCLDRSARDLGLQTAPGAAGTRPADRVDDDVTDVARVAERPVEQTAVEHDPAADAGRHHHREVVPTALRRPEPAFCRAQRLRVVVDAGRDSRTPRARRDRSGKPRHWGMLSGETESPPCSMGPPQPDPHGVGDAVRPVGDLVHRDPRRWRTGPPRRRRPSVVVPRTGSDPSR